ncbi:MAG TPA: GAF domain-containing protein, partial [Candidatus Binatia bacterium]
KCSRLFATLLEEYPLYANLGVASADGEQFCSAVPSSQRVSMRDYPEFQRALKLKDFTIGRYQIGQTSGKPSVLLNYPIRDQEGNVSGIVYAALDIAWLDRISQSVDLPAFSSLAVYDVRGTVLARVPDRERLIGKSLPETAILKTALAEGEGVSEAVGLDGKKRLYGFTSIGDASHDGRIFIHLGIPPEVALASANWLLMRNLLGLLLVSVMAFVGAWYAGDRFVLRPVRALVDTTERLGSGDFSARTGLPHFRNELGRLAGSFDKMAESLESQRHKTFMAGQQLEKNLARMKALHDIDMAITSTLDLRAMLSILLEKVDLVFPEAISTIRLINKETHDLEPVMCRNLDEHDWRTGNPRIIGGFSRIVLENKIPLTIANLQTDSRSHGHQFAQRYGLVSYLGVPLIAKGELLGLIAVYTRQSHSFTDDEIDYLSALASQSAIAIHNSTLFDELRRNAAELSALHGLTIASTKTLNLQTVLREAIQKITEIFHFDATRIFLFDSQMTELRLAAAFELKPELWAGLEKMERGRGIAGKVTETGEPVIFDDVRKSPNYADWSHSRILEKTGAAFLAILPIITKLKTWGVVAIVGEERRKLRPDETRLLNSMVNQIGIAVENATLYAQTDARAKELSTLYSIAGIASESLDIDVILRRAMEKVLEVFQFDAARIYLLNDDGSALNLVTHQGLPQDISLISSYQAGQGRLGRALLTGEAMFVADMATDPFYLHTAQNKAMLRAGYRRSVLIPLKVRGEALGVMNFLGRQPLPFSESDIQLINTIAYHLGIAVGNARLFSQVKKKTVELEAASKGKDEFLGVISHELRTPLNVIKGYTEIMLQGILGEVSPEQQKALMTIGAQSRELFNLISGVLQVTKIAADAVHSETWEVNLYDLLDEMQNNYNIPLSEGLAIEWDFPFDLPVIKTDDEKLKAIIQNLVNNAIKFTEEGVVRISVRHLVEADSIELRVADSGIGIAPEKLESIFEMFQQADSSASRKYGGVGLGLYIVKKFAELLGGSVTVQSKLAEGSTFIVTLPVGQAGSGEVAGKSKTLNKATKSSQASV